MSAIDPGLRSDAALVAHDPEGRIVVGASYRAADGGTGGVLVVHRLWD